MKRRVLSRVSQKPKASFLSVLGIVLAFSLLVFLGASGFSGKAVIGNTEVPETVIANCNNQQIQQYPGVPSQLQQPGDVAKIGQDIAMEIILPSEQDCTDACYRTIILGEPIDTPVARTTLLLNCNEEEKQEVYLACESACLLEQQYAQAYSEDDYQQPW